MTANRVEREWIQIFVAVCPVCGKKVKGFTEKQARRNLHNHYLTHHVEEQCGREMSSMR